MIESMLTNHRIPGGSTLSRRIEKRRRDDIKTDHLDFTYVDLNWFGLLSCLNDQLFYKIQPQMLFDFSECRIQFNANLSWKETSNEQDTKTEEKKSQSKKTEAGKTEGEVIALASCHLGIYGNKKDEINSDLWKDEIDCIAVGTVNGHIQVYIRGFKEDVDDTSHHDWNQCLVISNMNHLIPSSEHSSVSSLHQTSLNNLPTSISLHPTFHSLPPTVNGFLLSGTSQGFVVLWILTNLISNQPRAILSTVVSPPSLYSSVTCLLLVAPTEAFSPPDRPVVSDDSTSEVTSTDTPPAASSASPFPVPTAFVSWESGDVFLIRFILNTQLKSVCQRRRLWTTDQSIGQIYRCQSYWIPPRHSSPINRLVIVLSCTQALVCFQLLPKLEILFKKTRLQNCSPITSTPENLQTVTPENLQTVQSSFVGSFVGIIKCSETEWSLRFMIIENFELTIHSVSLVDNVWTFLPLPNQTLVWEYNVLDMMPIDASVVVVLENCRIVLWFVPVDDLPYILSQINISPLNECLSSSACRRFIGHCACTNIEDPNSDAIVLLLLTSSNSQISAPIIESFRVISVSPDVSVAQWMKAFDLHDQYQFDLVDLMLALLFYKAVLTEPIGKMLLQKIHSVKEHSLVCDQLCQQILSNLLNLLGNTNLSLETFSKLFRSINSDIFEEPHFPSHRPCLEYNSPNDSPFPTLLYSSFTSFLLSTVSLLIIEFLYLLSPDDWISSAPESLARVTTRLTELASQFSPIESAVSFTSNEEASPIRLPTSFLNQILPLFNSDCAHVVFRVMDATSKSSVDSSTDIDGQMSYWVECIIVYLLASQENKSQSISDSVNAAMKMYRRNVDEYSRYLLFELLESLMTVNDLRKDKPSAIELIIEILKTMNELISIDVRLSSRLFCIACLKPLRKIIEGKCQTRIWDNNWDSSVKELTKQTEDSQSCENKNVVDNFIIEQILLTGEILNQKLNNWKEEEFSLVEEMVGILLLINKLKNIQKNKMFNDRLSLFVNRFVQLSTQNKNDEDLYIFIHNLTDDNIDVDHLTECCLSTLISDSLNLNKFPRSILQLYVSLGRFQEGQTFARNNILTSLENNVTDIIIYYRPIQVLFDYQYALMSDSVVNKFWMDFIADLFTASVKAGSTGAVKIWSLLINEIFSFGWINNDKPTILLSPYRVSKLIFCLLERSLSQSDLTDQSKIDYQSPSLPANILSEISNSQQLLCSLAAYSASEERLLSVAVESYDRTIMKTLDELLSLEKNGKSQSSGEHGILYPIHDVPNGSPSSVHADQPGLEESPSKESNRFLKQTSTRHAYEDTALEDLELISHGFPET